MKLVILVCLLLYSCAKKENTIINPLHGSWLMKEIHYIYPDSTYSQPQAFTGRFLFTKNHYSIMYNPWTNERIPFQILSKPSDAEILASFKTIVFNSGSYLQSDSTITSTADIAKVPGFEGGKQFYRYKITGDQLDITMFDETYPDGKKPDWYGKLNVRFVLQREELLAEGN
ncbi:MAG: lipocalin-like domain-containing protein [Calditrichaeota bacterium]|nr:lipocalin-like domain-containing protein [Calditrichota bacterium]